MRTFAAFRVSMHCAFYLTIACITAVFAPCPLLPFTVLAGVLLGALLATGTDKKALRVLFMLLPLLGLLPASGPVPLLVAAVPAVYAFISIVSGRWRMETWAFRRELIILFVLMFFQLGAIILMGYTAVEPYRVPRVSARSAFVLFFLTFCFGIIAQRSLRMGNTRSRTWQLGSAGWFLIPIAAAAVFGVFARFVLFPVVKYTGYGISMAVMYGLVGLSRAVMYLYGLASQVAVTEPMTEPPELGTAPPAVDQIVEETEAPWVEIPKLRPGEINWVAVLAALLIAGIAVLIVVLVRRSHSERREYRDEGLREYGLE